MIDTWLLNKFKHFEDKIVKLEEENKYQRKQIEILQKWIGNIEDLLVSIQEELNEFGLRDKNE